MNDFNYTLIIIYFVLLAFLSIYGSHRYYLAFLFMKTLDNKRKPGKEFEKLPPVTIQLPLFNEMYVVERLIDSVVKTEYPKDLLEIQVLDDSTDETVEIVKARVEKYQKEGFDIKHIHRTNRQGFKAGALEEGMAVAKGEYIAVFDADFIPTPSFLKKTVHYFTDPKIGMIQMRWGHVNREYSLLTKLQAIFLDGHFVIEHTARNRTGRFFNFNGTAGIWRKETIIDAGGWQHDTLTEDLDLSYRAQMKGWEFVYLPMYEVPAELPVDIIAFKSQQHRWAKGSIQTAKKLLGRIFRSDYPLKVKIEAIFHLAGNINYLVMIPFSLLILPLIIVRTELDWNKWLIIDIPLFLLATTSISAFYLLSQKYIFPSWKNTFKYLPFLMGLGIGLSVNNSVAVIEALFGHESEFVRTPKFGVEDVGENWTKKKYRAKKKLLIPSIELILGIYFSIAVYIAFINHMWLVLPFLLLFLYGYLFIAFLSIKSLVEASLKRRKLPKVSSQKA
ncbi:MAG: glycosyltransferase [Acidobacteriota bacterium]